MKHSGKTAIFVTTLLAITSCNRFDRTSPLGSSVIAGLDSGAVTFDGAFTTEPYPLAKADLVTITDPLSGLHRYIDSLSNGGRVQSDMIIGSFKNETSFGYVTFLPKYTQQMGSGGTVITDTVIKSPGFYVDLLLKTGNYDMVNTALTFSVNTNNNTEDYYNLRLSTCPFVKDSIRIDTTKHHEMQNVLIPGNLSVYTVDLPYHFYSKTTNKTVSLTKVSGMIISPRIDTVKTTIRSWKNGTYEDDSTTVTTKIVKHTDTTLFKESKILDYKMFSKISSITNDTLLKLFIAGDSIQTYIGSKTVNSLAAFDTVIHKWKSIPSADSATDYLYLTRSNSEKRDTLREYKVGAVGTLFDSLHTITKTITSYLGDTVTQNMKRHLETVTLGRAYDTLTHSKVPYKAIDSLNILIKNMSGDNSLFHLKSVTLRIIGRQKGTTSVYDTISLAPSRATMTVFKTAPSTKPMLSGGLEQFVRLKVNTLPFWQMMRSKKYMNISKSEIKIPVDIAETNIPYRNKRINIKYFLHSKKQLNGELLRTSSRRSKSTVLYSHESELKLDITDLLLDQYYGDANPTPDTYLYLWIDGATMGQIVIDQTKDYQFSYIALNKQ